MTKRSVILKEGREAPLVVGHPWIFSGAIDSMPRDVAPGEMLPLFAADGRFLGQGYFNPACSLIGRLLTTSERPIEEVVREKVRDAVALRANLFSLNEAYRLIHAEGDGLPGLVVDCYGPCLVIQVGTAGMERLKPLIIETLKELMNPQGIYEQSHSNSRKEEGLDESRGWLWGEPLPEVHIEERGLRYIVSIEEGQKTGFFLDQREMRTLVTQTARGKRVLSCFAYSGSFGCAALKGGAQHVESVERCTKALELAKRNTALNGFKDHTFVCDDVFRYLENVKELDFDYVMLDPPAFAKKRSETRRALQGYFGLHKLVLERAKSGTLLLTSSCSSPVDEGQFFSTLARAAQATGRSLQILSHHRVALDHPQLLSHAEGSYLKSFLIRIK